MNHPERLDIDPAGAPARVRETFVSPSCKETAVTPAPCSSIACSIPIRKDHANP